MKYLVMHIVKSGLYLRDLKLVQRSVCQERETRFWPANQHAGCNVMKPAIQTIIVSAEYLR